MNFKDILKHLKGENLEPKSATAEEASRTTGRRYVSEQRDECPKCASRNTKSNEEHTKLECKCCGGKDLPVVKVNEANRDTWGAGASLPSGDLDDDNVKKEIVQAKPSVDLVKVAAQELYDSHKEHNFEDLEPGQNTLEWCEQDIRRHLNGRQPTKELMDQIMWDEYKMHAVDESKTHDRYDELKQSIDKGYDEMEAETDPDKKHQMELDRDALRGERSDIEDHWKDLGRDNESKVNEDTSDVLANLKAILKELFVDKEIETERVPSGWELTVKGVPSDSEGWKLAKTKLDPYIAKSNKKISVGGKENNLLVTLEESKVNEESPFANPKNFNLGPILLYKQALETLKTQLGIKSDPIRKDFLVFQEGTSNKFHLFVMFKKGDTYTAANAYGRIGNNPQYIIFASGDQWSVEDDYRKKIRSKFNKGYEKIPSEVYESKVNEAIPVDPSAKPLSPQEYSELEARLDRIERAYQDARYSGDDSSAREEQRRLRSGIKSIKDRLLASRKATKAVTQKEPAAKSWINDCAGTAVQIAFEYEDWGAEHVSDMYKAVKQSNPNPGYTADMLADATEYAAKAKTKGADYKAAVKLTAAFLSNKNEAKTDQGRLVVKKESIPCAMCGTELAPGTIYCADCDYVNESKETKMSTHKLYEAKRAMRKWGPEDEKNYMGESYPQYYVGFAKTRDSDALEVSNFDVALARLGGEDDMQVKVVRLGHWAVGWVEVILVHELATTKVNELQKMVDSYNSYPVLDEDDYYDKAHQMGEDEPEEEEKTEEEEEEELAASMVPEESPDQMKLPGFESNSFDSLVNQLNKVSLKESKCEECGADMLGGVCSNCGYNENNPQFAPWDPRGMAEAKKLKEEHDTTSKTMYGKTFKDLKPEEQREVSKQLGQPQRDPRFVESRKRKMNEGAGNYLPPSPWRNDENYEMVYVDLAQEGEYDEDLYSMAYQDFEDELASICTSLGLDRVKSKWLGNDTSLFAEDNNTQVMIADNQSTIAVVVAQTEADDAMEEDEFREHIANVQYRDIAAKLFTRLGEMYRLSVRSGPWMSSLSKYSKVKESIKEDTKENEPSNAMLATEPTESPLDPKKEEPTKQPEAEDNKEADADTNVEGKKEYLGNDGDDMYYSLMTLGGVEDTPTLESVNEDDAPAAEPVQPKYKIIRYSKTGGQRVVRRGLSREDAKMYCQRPDTKGKNWFCGFTAESKIQEDKTEVKGNTTIVTHSVRVKDIKKEVEAMIIDIANGGGDMTNHRQERIESMFARLGDEKPGMKNLLKRIDDAIYNLVASYDAYYDRRESEDEYELEEEIEKDNVRLEKLLSQLKESKLQEAKYQVVDANDMVVYPKKGDEVESGDAAKFIVDALQALKIANVSYDIVMKYILPPADDKFDNKEEEEEVKNPQEPEPNEEQHQESAADQAKDEPQEKPGRMLSRESVEALYMKYVLNEETANTELAEALYKKHITEKQQIEIAQMLLEKYKIYEAPEDEEEDEEEPVLKPEGETEQNEPVLKPEGDTPAEDTPEDKEPVLDAPEDGAQATEAPVDAETAPEAPVGDAGKTGEIDAGEGDSASGRQVSGLETPSAAPMSNDPEEIAKFTREQIKQDNPEEPYTTTALAFADSFVHDPQVYGRIRSLKWQGIYTDVDTFQKQAKIVGPFNNFNAEEAKKLGEKFGESAKYKLARDGDVYVYITVRDTTKEHSLEAVKDLVNADIVQATSNPGEIMVWWS